MDEPVIHLLSETELSLALEAEVMHPQNRSVTGISTDSRKVTETDLFFALSGERFDAHDFIPSVIANGCRAIVVSKAVEVPEDVAVFRVADVLKSLGFLTRKLIERRRACGPFQVYGITGSNGKTTTKEILASLLEAQGKRVLKTAGNFNNNIGLPLTVAGLCVEHDAAVLEMGANAPGEIDYLCSIGLPDAGIITSIGNAHLEGFGSIEGVASAKGEMLNWVKKIVLPSDTKPYYANSMPSDLEVTWIGDGGTAYASDVIQNLEGIAFLMHTATGHYSVRLPLLGVHNAENFVRAFALIDSNTWSSARIQEAADHVRLPSGRMEHHAGIGGISLIHDAYNANPSSMQKALDLMAQISTPSHRCLILGDMRELGATSDTLHRELGEKAARLGAKRILCVGDSAEHIAAGALSVGFSPSDVTTCSTERLSDGLDWLKPALTEGCVCLIKGSRGVRLERVLEDLKLKEAD